MSSTESNQDDHLAKSSEKTEVFDDSRQGQQPPSLSSSGLRAAVALVQQSRSDRDYVVEDSPREEEHGRLGDAASTGSNGENTSHRQQQSSPPSFVKTGRRSPSNPNHSARKPHFMAPLNREVNPVLLQTKPVDDGSAFVPPIPASREAFTLPTPVEMLARESAKRNRIEEIEHKSFVELLEIHKFHATDIIATAARREKYLQSADYTRATAAGKEKLARLAQQEEERKRKESDFHFRPTITRHAARLPPRTVDQFVEQSKQWSDKLEKKRRSASAAVFREEDATFAPKILSSSAKIVDRLQKESKRVGIVEGWMLRMEEHKKRMKDLEDRYALPFHPRTDEARSGRGSRRAASHSPKRVPAREVITRLYDGSIEHKKAVEAKRDKERRGESPQPTRRSESAIRKHLEEMQARIEKSHKKLETKRARSEREELSHDEYTFSPAVNAHSAELAAQARQHRISGSRAPSARPDGGDEPSRVVAPPPPGSAVAAESSRSSRQSIHEVLYKTATEVAGIRHKLREQSAAASPERKRMPPRTSTGSRDFFLRNDRLLQSREMHVRELQGLIEEQSMKECTFAPSISSNTVRLAEGRRSGTQYADIHGKGSHYRDPEDLSGGPLRNLRVQASAAPPRPPKSPSSPQPRRSQGDPVVFHRTDDELQAQRRQASVTGNRGDSIQERLDDIEGLLKEWKWLEESSRT